MRALLKHQANGFKWAKSRRVLPVFWEMRLGKTLLVIRWAEWLGLDKILVVAPLSVLESWEEELEAEGLRGVVLHGTKAQREKILQANLDENWFLLNYEAISQRAAPGEGTRKNGKRKKRRGTHPSPYALLPWDCVVADESTRIRKADAQVTKVACRHLSQAPYKVALSGLPNPEGPEDYFSQFVFLYGQFMGHSDFWKWRQKYFKRWGFEWKPKPGTVGKIKAAVNQKANVLTRKNAGLGSRKIREVRRVDLPPKIRTAYNAIEKDMMIDTAFGPAATKYAVVKRTWLQRIAGGFPIGDLAQWESAHKVRELLDLAAGELKKEQFVVFFRFNAELNAARRAFQAAGVPCTGISGKTPRELRQKRRNAFQAGKKRVVFCQTMCVRYGLDFSAASTVVYFSNWDEFEIRGQSEDRIIHVNKKEPLLYLDLVTRDTIDDDIRVALRGKSCNAKQFQNRLLRNMAKRHGKGKK